LFDRIVINRQGLTGEPIDLGFLAECIIFYRKVRIIADSETFRYLVRCCGPDELLELFSMGVLEIEFFDNLTGVGTVVTDVGPVHELVVIDSQNIRYPQVARQFFDELAGSSGKGSNKMFNRFQRVVERSRYTPVMLEQSHTDLLDNSYVGPAIKSCLSSLLPST